MKLKKTLINLTAAMMCCFSVAAHADESAEDALLQKLRGMYPSTQFSVVHKTGISGIYEIVMGKNIGYTDNDGRFFLFGHVFDMKTQQDLTAKRLEGLNTLNFADLPLKDAIKEKRGDGSRVLAIFTDPDCPYCKKLEQELSKLDNVTIYTFLYPLEGLHPDAPRTAKSIWCSSNKQAALHDYMLNSKPPKPANCDNPIDRNVQLGQKLNVNGTPTLVAKDGRIMPGFANIEQIEKWLSGQDGK